MSFSNSSCDVVHSGEEDESSLPDIASMLGQCHFNYYLHYSTTIASNIFGLYYKAYNPPLISHLH